MCVDHTSKEPKESATTAITAMQSLQSNERSVETAANFLQEVVMECVRQSEVMVLCDGDDDVPAAARRDRGRRKSEKGVARENEA